MTEILKFKGYTITYNPQRQLFQLVDKDGNEVGSGKSQEEVETQADRLIKQAGRFPIPAYRTYGSGVESGRITSIDPSQLTVWFVEDKKEGDYTSGQRGKYDLSNRIFYEMTEANKLIADQIASRRSQIKQLEQEIRDLAKTFTNPIGPKYFGLNQEG